jgi:predicted RNase H-like nuclease (RuvC/YqgF family)
MGITVDAAPGKLRLLADWLDATCPDGETEVQDDLRNIAKMVVGFERTIRHHESEYTRLTAHIAELERELKFQKHINEETATLDRLRAESAEAALAEERTKYEELGLCNDQLQAALAEARRDSERMVEMLQGVWSLCKYDLESADWEFANEVRAAIADARND